MYSAGFSTTDLERANKASDILFTQEQTRRSLVAAAGKAYAAAQEAHDHEAMWQIIQGARSQGIDFGSVFRSAAGRNKAGRLDLLERSFSLKNRQTVSNLMPDGM